MPSSFFTLYRTVGKPLFINTRFVVSVDFVDFPERKECVADIAVQENNELIRYVWGSAGAIEEIMLTLEESKSKFVHLVTDEDVKPSVFFGSSRYEQERAERILDDWAFNELRNKN